KAKTAVATGEAITVDNDDKPPEAPKTDNPTVTPSTDSTQTIAPSSAVALAPTAGPATNQTPKPDPDADEQPLELPQLSAMAAGGVPKWKGMDEVKAGVGKQSGAGKKADAEMPVDADASPAEATADVQPADKVTPQSHGDKPQFVSSEGDKDRASQARGEAPGPGHRSADTPESLSGDNSNSSPSIQADAATPTMVTEPAPTTPAAAAPATAAAQAAAQQAAPIPLAGLAVEIAGKAI